MNSDTWKIKLQIVKKYHDKNGDWVTCLDSNGNMWSMSQEQFDTYKFTNIPYVSSDVEKKFLDILNGRYYNSLSAEERKNVIIKTLEAFYGLPIDNIIPNVVHSNLS